MPYISHEHKEGPVYGRGTAQVINALNIQRRVLEPEVMQGGCSLGLGRTREPTVLDFANLFYRIGPISERCFPFLNYVATSGWCHGPTMLPRSRGVVREVDEPPVLAHTIRHLSDVYLEQGRSDLAEPCYHEALSFIGVTKTIVADLANNIHSLAVLRWEQTKALWEEVRELYAALNDETIARPIR